MRKLLLVLAVVAVLAPACASKEKAAEEPSNAPATSAAAMAGPKTNDRGTETFTDQTFSVAIEQDNFYFDPTFVKAPGNSTAKVTLTNEGTADHTFTIDALNIDQELKPGEKKEIEVKLGTETRYEFYCRYHKDRGMRGAFQPH